MVDQFVSLSWLEERGVGVGISKLLATINRAQLRLFAVPQVCSNKVVLV